MAKVFIEETTLTAIGDAIREKTGGTDLIAPGSMPAEIKAIVSGGGGEGDCNGLHLPEEALIISGSCDYRFYLGAWDWFIEEYGNKITTQDISNTQYMFANGELQSIPFELNFRGTFTSNVNNMFANCYDLLTIPAMNNLMPSNLGSMFSYCRQLKSIPDDLTDNWDWSYIENSTSKYEGNMNNMFQMCNNLRQLPTWTFLHCNPNVNYSSSIFYGGFQDCWSLERIEGIRLPKDVTWTSNAFNNAFKNCYRLKSLTFALQDDGTPYVHNISKQTIDLTTAGYLAVGGASSFKLYCQDFTEDDIIDSWDKWETYFGDTGLDVSRGTGNGYADNVKWSTFSRTAAKRMFATLPDVTGGSSNTIKLLTTATSELKSQEAMKLLTEEEIAVAAARGWTVSLV